MSEENKEFPWFRTKTTEDELWEVLVELDQLEEGQWEKRTLEYDREDFDGCGVYDESVSWTLRFKTKLGSVRIDLFRTLGGIGNHHLEIMFWWKGANRLSFDEDFEKGYECYFPEVTQDLFREFFGGLEERIKSKIKLNYWDAMEDYVEMFGAQEAIEETLSYTETRRRGLEDA